MAQGMDDVEHPFVPKTDGMEEAEGELSRLSYYRAATRQLTDVNEELRAELRKLQLQLEVRDRHQDGDLSVSDGPRAPHLSDSARSSLLTHFPGREEGSPFTPRPTPRPRTRAQGALLVPENTPVTSSPVGTSMESRGSTVLTRETGEQSPVSVEVPADSPLGRVAGSDVKPEICGTAPSVKSRRPNIIPDRFSGKTPWRDYQHHFEACKLANEWSDAHAKIFLAAGLQGAAIKVLGN